jgi:myo-inositol 2-dehydrogenase / D-chiro-inositol 1-dehydrogenase
LSLELLIIPANRNLNASVFVFSGAVVTLFLSRSATYGYDQRCEIFGTQGLAAVGNPHEHEAKLCNVHGISRSRLAHSFPQRFEKAFALELDTFANVLVSQQRERGDGNKNGNASCCTWPVTAEQCIHVQQVADAARLSCETGQVVRI